MKNREFYANEMINIALNRQSIAIDKNSGAPINCCMTICSDCLFNTKCSPELLQKWANEEFTVKLSEKEKTFLSMFTHKSHGYIARDKDKSFLYLYYTEPAQLEIGERWTGAAATRLNPELFSFITYESNKFWSLEELFKLK